MHVWHTLWVRADWYPATMPMSRKDRSKAVIIAPRLAGERKPRAAKKMVHSAMPNTCAPTPMLTANKKGNRAGGRNTSPWTSFQPLSSRSSARSSSVGTRLYRIRS